MLKRLSSATFNYGLGQVIPKIVGFLLIPLYTIYLTPGDYGMVELATSASALILSVVRLGIPGAVSRFYYDYKGTDDESVYISTLYIGLVVVSFVISCIFLVIGYFFIDNLVPGLPFYPFFIIILLSSFLNSSSDIQRRLLQVREQSRYNAVLNIVTTFAGILVAIVLVVFFKWGALGIVMAALATNLLMYIQAQSYLKKDLRFIFNRNMFQKSLRYSMPILPYHVLANFAPVFSKSILSVQASLSSVGLFGIASRMTQPLQIFSNAISTAYSPIYFSMRTDDNDSDVRKKVINTFTKIWVLSLLLFFGIFLFSEPVLLLITPQSYHAAHVCIKILAVGFLPSVLYLFFIQEIFYQKKTKIALLINVITVVLNIGLSFILVERFEENGVALSSVCPLFVSAGMAYYFSHKYFTLPVDWKLILLLSGLVCLTALATLSFSYSSLLWQMIVSIIIYLFVVIVVLLIEKETFKVMVVFLKKILNKRG